MQHPKEAVTRVDSTGALQVNVLETETRCYIRSASPVLVAGAIQRCFQSLTSPSKTSGLRFTSHSGTLTRAFWHGVGLRLSSSGQRLWRLFSQTADGFLQASFVAWRQKSLFGSLQLFHTAGTRAVTHDASLDA
jgi:hypothetical protein